MQQPPCLYNTNKLIQSHECFYQAEAPEPCWTNHQFGNCLAEYFPRTKAPYSFSNLLLEQSYQSMALDLQVSKSIAVAEDSINSRPYSIQWNTCCMSRQCQLKSQQYRLPFPGVIKPFQFRSEGLESAGSQEYQLAGLVQPFLELDGREHLKASGTASQWAQHHWELQTPRFLPPPSSLSSFSNVPPNVPPPTFAVLSTLLLYPPLFRLFSFFFLLGLIQPDHRLTCSAHMLGRTRCADCGKIGNISIIPP